MIRAFSLSCFFVLAATALRGEVVVFAAASLKEPLDRVAAVFDDVIVSYGGSGTLARQISLGAPADVVLLANVAWMDVLVAGGHMQTAQVADFASNRLVLVSQAGRGQVTLDQNGFSAALGDQRLAVGLTNSVPAGIYAKSALQSLGLWETTKNRLAEVENVRVARALVARGQVPLGIIYATDVRFGDKVVAVASFDPATHPPIRYVGGVISGASQEAADFWAYLRGPSGQAIFEQAGFLPASAP